MNTKKIVVLALVLILAFSFGACVKNTPVSSSGDTSSPSPTASNNPSPSAESSPSPTSSDVPLGVTTDTQYTNEALGVSFTLPEGWRFATNEEIALALQIGADALTDSKSFKEALLEQPYFFDVMALDASGTNNFNINYTDLAKSGIGAQMSEATFGALSESQLKQMSDAYEDAIFTHETLPLGEGEFVSMSVDATATTLGLYQRQYYKKVNQTYFVVITITGETAQKVDEIASLF